MPEKALSLALTALEHWAALAGGTVPPDQRPVAPLERSWDWLHENAQATVAPNNDVLRTIFSRLHDTDGTSTAPQAIVKPQRLQLTEEVLFPLASPDVTLDPAPLGAALRAELDTLAARELPEAARLDALLFLLQCYGWALPSALPGVSLYDMARLHAALAAATAAEPNGELCLVGGDISGVQDFIYSVPAEGAAKQLRGRSLYLQLLTDACAHFVLYKAGMPLCNLLYAGGGRFYALVPASALDQLSAWRKDIGNVLLQAHGGALYLALDGVPFAPTAYAADHWRELSDGIDAAKRRRFADLDEEKFKELFEPQQPAPPKPEDSPDSEPLDDMGESLADLGRRLGRATLLAVTPGVPREPVRELEKWHEVVAALGYSVRPLDDLHDLRSRSGQRQRLLFLNDEQVDEARATGHDVVGLRYTVTEARQATADDVMRYRQLPHTNDDDQELDVNGVLPFNYLAAMSAGVPRIGVLRMDVDDLGNLFGKGIKRPTGIAGLAITAALSAALSRFFEGWVGELCREFNAGTGGAGIYAVYSGGDDLFLVGSWHLMPELAQRIRDDFARYVLGRPLRQGERPPLTLSGGLTLHSAGFPLYQAADDAASALGAAKDFQRPSGHAKDAITFLGRTLGWEQFAEARTLQEELHELVAFRNAPRGLLMTIQRLDAQAQQKQRRGYKGAPQLGYGPWVWQGAYQLTRLAERDKANEKTIEALREGILGSKAIAERTIERAGLAARWAQLRMRGEGDR